MTYYYYKTWTMPNGQPPNQETVNMWKHLADKTNWRIVELPNGYFQTEYKQLGCECDEESEDCCGNWKDVTRRESVEAAERAIDNSVEHYTKKLEFIKGPKVVKTFK